LKTKKLIFFFYWKWKVGGTMKKWKLINNLLIAYGDIYHVWDNEVLKQKA
jgi:hypothetical protein